ncbi:hypothetical protein Dda_7337 [Drechslerella dactyloides]|uniref:Uncharacterized protein n=1 Tax=Drechslerella dactyloides TaxID=74499 RepID=A0AAD6ISE5_DREDA|nr:hypothetical protein Dda_7337 [Drechslerella dactyloides]
MQFLAIILAIPAVLAVAVPQPGYGAPPQGYPAPAGNGPYSQDPRRRCIQEWFGTAPLCEGQCPNGWRLIRTSTLAGECDKTDNQKIVSSCNNQSANECMNGIKALCEQCY